MRNFQNTRQSTYKDLNGGKDKVSLDQVSKLIGKQSYVLVTDEARKKKINAGEDLEGILPDSVLDKLKTALEGTVLK